MNILRETADIQILDFTPKINGVKIIEFIDESTDEVEIYNVSESFLSAYYERVQMGFNLKEDKFYTFVCRLADQTEIYRGRVFCTNQDISTLTTLKNKFVVYGQ